jgi:hypothetical protein
MRVPGKSLRTAKSGTKETGLTPKYNHKMYLILKSIYELLIVRDLCIFAGMANQGASAGPGSRSVVANYVATLSGELATLAKRNGLDTFGYLLEMVRLEAENETRHSQNGGGR